MSKKPHNPNELARFSAMGIQMVSIIGIFVYIGYRLDKNYATSKPWFTLGLSIFGVTVAMIYMIRAVTRK